MINQTFPYYSIFKRLLLLLIFMIPYYEVIDFTQYFFTNFVPKIMFIQDLKYHQFY